MVYFTDQAEKVKAADLLQRLHFESHNSPYPIINLCNAIGVERNKVRLGYEIQIETQIGWVNASDLFSHLRIAPGFWATRNLQRFQSTIRAAFVDHMTNMAAEGRVKQIEIRYKGKSQRANIIAADSDNFPHTIQVTVTNKVNPIWIHPACVCKFIK